MYAAFLGNSWGLLLKFFRYSYGISGEVTWESAMNSSDLEWFVADQLGICAGEPGNRWESRGEHSDRASAGGSRTKRLTFGIPFALFANP